MKQHPKFLLTCRGFSKRFNASDLLRSLKEAALDLFLAVGSSFLCLSSSCSHHNPKRDVLRISSRAPLDFPKSSFVRTYASIRGWGDQRKVLDDFLIDSTMIASSTAVRLS